MQVYKILILILCTSCSSYVNKLHSKMSSDYKKRNNRTPQSMTYERVGQENPGSQRYVASDFEDNEPSPSLWTGTGSDSFFDSASVKKEKGDIITILVMGDLKEKIQNELERAFSKNKDGQDQATTTTGQNKKQVFDKISSIVNKEIRSNHILLIGRKELIFENVKRMIELSALINRKDISAEDTVDSVKILQTKIRILR